MENDNFERYRRARELGNQPGSVPLKPAREIPNPAIPEKEPQKLPTRGPTEEPAEPDKKREKEPA